MKRMFFLILAVMLLVLFTISMWQDSTREWTEYQHAFAKTLKGEERRGATRGIQQFIVKDLDRVDRCTTCHVAIDKPQLALAEQPFTAHPSDFLKWHPIEKFGCTVCHGGQGLATEVRAAHGDVGHWEEPLLRGPLIQSSCRQCHGNLNVIEGHVPLLVEGQRLFEAKGCYGCHAVKTFGKEFGQTVSVALSDVGRKPSLLMAADLEMMPDPHDRIHWLRRKLEHPRALNPGVRAEELPDGEEEVFPSAMPNFGFTEDEVDALTVYLLSLTGSDYPTSYVTQPIPTPEPEYTSKVAFGRAVFDKFGCAACHGIGGVGGRRNWNAGLGEEVPSLLYVKAYYGDDLEGLKDLIRTGRQPVPRGSVHRPQPGLYMPPWKGRIAEPELDALVAYLLSLDARLPKPPPVTDEQASLPDVPPNVPNERSVTN